MASSFVIVMEPGLYNQGVAIVRASSLFLIFWLTLAGGCTRPPVTEKAPLDFKTHAELQGHLLKQKADLGLFRLRGPFAVAERKNHELRLSATERVSTDLFLSAAADKAPLVVFVHGHDSSKEAHAHQASHLASWGMHSLALQLPKSGPWVINGRILARIVNFIYRSPGALDNRIDVNRIILVGHSFGAASVAVALGDGAPAAGGILLDPATADRDLPGFLRRIKKPVMVLGADENLYPTRNREYFYRFVRSGIAEVSIRDATHEDAQYPSDFALQNLGFDPYTTEELQVTFVSALTAAALSLSATGGFDHAWTSFAAVVQNGKFFNARKK